MNSMTLAQARNHTEHEIRPDAPRNPRGFGERIEKSPTIKSAGR